MKYLLLNTKILKGVFTLLLLPFSLFVNAQKPAPNTCNKTFYKSGKISSSICLDKDGRFGKAFVISAKGDTVKIWHLRTIGGSAWVSFDFHANGGVKKASFSDHPDGGIQWYQEWITFSEKGEIISKNEEKYPFETTTYFKLDTTLPEKPQKQNTIKCATLVQTEAWIFNASKKKTIIIATHLNTETNIEFIEIAPQTRAKICTRVNAEQYINPLENRKIYLAKAKGDISKLKLLKLLPDGKPVKESETLWRQWYRVR